jgi:hypothetical protein
VHQYLAEIRKRSQDIDWSRLNEKSKMNQNILKLINQAIKNSDILIQKSEISIKRTIELIVQIVEKSELINKEFDIILTKLETTIKNIEDNEKIYLEQFEIAKNKLELIGNSLAIESSQFGAQGETLSNLADELLTLNNELSYNFTVIKNNKGKNAQTLTLMLNNLNISYGNIIEIITFSKNIRNNLQNILEHILSLDQESTKHQKQIKEFWEILEEYYKSVLYIEDHEKKVLDINQKANAKIMEIYNLQ